MIDVSWYWANTLRMQRAADAAALAGVVYLPGNPTLAYSTARAEAVKNGYTDGVGGVAVTPVQDPQDSRRLRVSVSGPVNTYFARVLGLTSLNARRDSKADFVLPVPMGSPQNYYGVSALKGSTTTSVTNTVVTNHFDNTRNSGLDVATTAPAGTPWVTSTGVGHAVRRRRLDQQRLRADEDERSDAAIRWTSGLTARWGPASRSPATSPGSRSC